MTKIRPDQPEWLKKRLYHRWQVLRRHPDYLNFCKDLTFDDGLLDDVYERAFDPDPEEERIKELFGLSQIYDPSYDLTEDDFLNLPVFEEPLAVRYVWHTDREEYIEETNTHLQHRTTIWDEHFIKLKIDISDKRKMSQILSEVRECIEGSRAEMKLQNNPEYFKDGGKIQDSKDRFVDDEEVYRVFDLWKQGKRPKEIIQEVWPAEYRQEFSEKPEDPDQKYIELCDRYRNLRKADWDERAYLEVYDSNVHNPDSSGPIRLYQRVRDNLRKMEESFKKVEHQSKK